MTDIEGFSPLFGESNIIIIFGVVITEASDNLLDLKRDDLKGSEASMKFLGLSFGKEKAVSFQDFRDIVRIAVRRKVGDAQFEPRDYGFVLRSDGKPPTTCNLRNLYTDYCKTPELRDKLVHQWLDTLTMEIPDHSWTDAMMTLRPTLKNSIYVGHALKQMQKNDPPDSLPYSPFAGELAVIVMRELSGTAVGVTQNNLDNWGVSFEQCLKQALNNMNMMPIPEVSSTLHTPSNIKGVPPEEVGFVFEHDHLTATWLVVPRFRDYVSQRLMSDYVAFVPTRNRLTVVRANASAMLTNIQGLNRNLIGQMHALTAEGFHVDVATTGGVVSIYKWNRGLGGSMDANSPFAKNSETSQPDPAPYKKPAAVDLSAWGGLVESTDD